MIWTYTFPKHQELKKSLLESIKYSQGKEFANDCDQITKTDYYEKLELEQKHYLTLFHSNIHDMYVQMQDYYCLAQFSLYNGWYQQYYTGDTHAWHVHALTTLSMVYYLELEEPADRTEFWIPETREICQADAKEGDMVIFPAHIPHRSPPISGNTRKTIISINYNVGAIDSKKINNGK